MSNSIVRWMAAGCLLAGLVGCPGGSGGSANTVAVTGTVTRGGKPVKGANVSFVPQGQGARAAFGTTDASGRFSLTTLKPGDGAIPGQYGVTVEKAAATAPASAPPAGLDPASPEGMAAARAAYEETKATADPSAKPEDLLPEKFKTVATSRLKANVQAAGGNDFTFDLKD